MSITRLAISLGVLVLALAAPAASFAQTAPPAGGAQAPGSAPAPAPGSAPAPAAGAPAAGAPAPAASPGLAGWPTAVSEQPFTLNQGMLEVRGALPFFALSGSDTVVLAGVGASYGLADQLEIGADYAFEVSPSTDAGGLITAHVTARLAQSARVSAALGGAVAFSDPASGFALAGGLSLRYRVTPTVSLYTTSSGVPLCGACLQFLGPVTGQLVVFVPTDSGGSTLALLNLPVGVGIQASPRLYLYGETSLGTIVLNDTSSSLLEFSDYTGVNVGAWLAASNKLSLGASLFDDLQAAGDFYLVEVMARAYL